MTGSGVTCPRCEVEVEVGELFGIEVPGTYDGVLIWQHRLCGHAWPRFSPPGRLYDAGRWHLDVVEALAGTTDPPIEAEDG